jgi:protein-disulfide isomerase
MPKALVNFGAAVALAIVVIACNSANTTQRAEGATPAASQSDSQSKTTPTGTNDPVIAAADKGRIAGDSTAKTWVIIASDFQCPFCRQWHSESYKQFVDEYVRTGKVKVAYINFPLGQHQNAVPTAIAAMCASAQNSHDRCSIPSRAQSALISRRGASASIPRRCVRSCSRIAIGLRNLECSPRRRSSSVST